MSSSIKRLIEFGQSPWYDNLTRADRDRRRSAALVDEHGIRGVTSNPTIFEKAMASGNDYDAQLREVAAAGASPHDAYWDLVTTDIGHATDILRPNYEAWEGHDGFVSVEVSPDLARDTDGTIAQAKELLAAARPAQRDDQDPGDRRGHPCDRRGARRRAQRERHVHFQPGSLRRSRECVLRRPREAASPPATTSPASRRWRRSSSAGSTPRPIAASPTVTRCEAAPRSPTPSSRTSTSSATFAGARWEALVAKGARVQRPLWASTSTKNPAYSPTLYVDTLIGRDTVNTLAQASVDVLEAGQGDLRADAVLEEDRRGPRHHDRPGRRGRRLRRRDRHARA